MHDRSVADELKSVAVTLEDVVMIGNNHNYVHEASGAAHSNDCGLHRQGTQVSGE